MISLHILPSSVDSFADLQRFPSVDDATFKAQHAAAIVHPDVTEVCVIDMDTGERIAKYEYARGSK